MCINIRGKGWVKVNVVGFLSFITQPNLYSFIMTLALPWRRMLLTCIHQHVMIYSCEHFLYVF